MKYPIPKGVFDILPQEPNPENHWRNSDHWQYVEKVMREIALTYGYREIRTPIFERTELFTRSVGESSDIVSKEMYTFEDRGGRSLSLRPEGTASVMRAFVENNLNQYSAIHKFFYIGPMFRYERPQAGRYRQHHQFGVEAIGISAPEQDVEMIDMVCELYRRLGLKNLTVLLNCVGDASSREHYKTLLIEHLRPSFALLSPDSQVRFSKNVLRILDSKEPQDQKLLENAPSILDALNEECQEHFLRVRQLLERVGITHTITPRLVRGLDYYNKTVFEVTSSSLGAQNSLGGGGRYDGLLSALGGPPLPAVGFATGIERILQTMTNQELPFPSPPHPFIFLIALGNASKEFCFQLLCQLHREGIPAEMELQGKKPGSALQLAASLGCEYVLVIGDEELKSEHAAIKNMHSRESVSTPLPSLLPTLKKLFSSS